MSRSRPNLSMAQIIFGKQCIVFFQLALTNSILFRASNNALQFFFKLGLFSCENRTKIMMVPNPY